MAILNDVQFSFTKITKRSKNSRHKCKPLCARSSFKWDTHISRRWSLSLSLSQGRLQANETFKRQKMTKPEPSHSHQHLAHPSLLSTLPLLTVHQDPPSQQRAVVIHRPVINIAHRLSTNFWQGKRAAWFNSSKAGKSIPVGDQAETEEQEKKEKLSARVERRKGQKPGHAKVKDLFCPTSVFIEIQFSHGYDHGVPLTILCP